MFRKSTIKKREVRINEICDAEILVDQMCEELARFRQHGSSQYVVVLGVKIRIRSRRIDPIEVQPLIQKIVNEAFAALVRQHAADLFVECFWIGESSLTGKLKQLHIGRAAPQEIG